MSEQQELPDMPEPVEPPPAPEPGPFEITGDVETRVDLTIDLAGLIREYPDEYRMATLQGHEEYERPMVFLWEYLEDQQGVQSYGDHRYVKEGPWDNFEFNESKRWSQEQFDALVAVCPEAKLDGGT